MTLGHDTTQATAAPVRFSRVRYEAMVTAGVFGEDDHIELLQGVIVHMPPQHVPHATSVVKLNKKLVAAYGDDAEVRPQLPFAAGPDSMPEPDLAVVPLGQTDHHPTRAILIVEVADTSSATDRTVKAAIYAAAGVPEFWIVDCGRRLVEIHTVPLDDHYGACRLARPGDRIALPSLDGAAVAVADLF